MKFKAGDLVELKGHMDVLIERSDQEREKWIKRNRPMPRWRSESKFFDTHAIITQVAAPCLIKIILPDGQNFWMRASKAKLAFDERSQTS